MQQCARILIVDDHPAVREALGLWIERHIDLKVCGEATDTTGALRLFDATRTYLLLVVDISLKTGNGIDLIKRLKSRDATVRILVWSMHIESIVRGRGRVA